MIIFFSQEVERLTIIQEMFNKLSSELDLKGANQDLMKRNMSLEATNQALVEQCDVIRSGNMNLLQQLQTNSKTVEVNGKITDTQYQDTIKVFAKNLEHEKQRCVCVCIYDLILSLKQFFMLC